MRLLIMRRAKVFVKGVLSGILEEKQLGGPYEFVYDVDYNGPPVSLTMPLTTNSFHFPRFPPFFDGLLPEGLLLEGLLRRQKIDQYDYFSQIIVVGKDLVGAVTIKEIV
ncbi:HipA N-terminal domain-containing protein [Caldithrix abyssi]|nr:HipA N-terminal domain-containing protein [Caldithrix abyssi]